MPDFAELPFAHAAPRWLESRRPYISSETYREYVVHTKTLAGFFAEMHLHKIDGEQIRAYQRARSITVGPSSINKECSLLQQMLKRIGRWQQISFDYQPLSLPKESRGRALTDQEYERLFRVASSNPSWEAAYLFAVISVNTTTGPKETMTLRLQDVDLERRSIFVHSGGAKNIHRIREIPLNDQSWCAAKRALERAHELGARAAEHYLFPFLVKRGRYDPSRHQTSFKGAWKSIRTAANIDRFRMYDLRHHVITCLLEDPTTSEETVEAIAGHISHRIKKRYSHVRVEYRRTALQRLGSHSEDPSIARERSLAAQLESAAWELGTTPEKLLKAIVNLMPKKKAG